MSINRMAKNKLMGIDKPTNTIHLIDVQLDGHSFRQRGDSVSISTLRTPIHDKKVTWKHREKTYTKVIHLVYFTLYRLIQGCEIILYYLLTGVDWREYFPQKFS